MADDPKFRQGREGNLGQGQLGEGREPDLQKGDRSRTGASGFSNQSGAVGRQGGGETAGTERAEQSTGPQGGFGGQKLQDRNQQQYGSQTQGGLNKREDDPSTDVE